MERSSEMTHPKLAFGLFLAVAAVQLFIPISQIRRYEDVLQTGRLYKFRTAPMDPYDVFRGKYVALIFADTTATIHKGDTIGPRDPAYVTLHEDNKGFALFGELAEKPPTSGEYLRVEFLYSYHSVANFQLPFDSYFMEESKAPQAEQAYWRYSNRRGQDRASEQTYVTVHVKNGRGVIDDLFIKDQPVREFIKTMPK
jgi:uncharacterized membrane-anchored protein